ncbi:MAG: hypothetical protein C0434_02495 [Xanthomonadaceae bacterium]|nr:hypothetical protein [Xanthomonadaceae bacterium]
MWHAELSRKEVLEIFLGVGRSTFSSLRETHVIRTQHVGDLYDVYWPTKPTPFQFLPTVIVTPDDGSALFAAVNSNPQSITPVSAFSRCFTREEASAFFDGQTSLALGDGERDVMAILAALAMAEATALSEGRVGLRQLTPALCKRTLSYAWGRAIAVGLPGKLLGEVPMRWISSYSLINPHNAQGRSGFRETNYAVVPALTVAAELRFGIKPHSLPGELAQALLIGAPVAVSSLWQQLSTPFVTHTVDLALLAQSSREERGALLQSALKVVKEQNAHENLIAACAFLATQVAPASLEHLALLSETGKTSILMWYALYAAIQHPGAVLSGNGALGQRVMRDISVVEDPVSRPSSDVSFTELKTLERVGIESFARRSGHVGELEVELFPLVKSSFTVPNRKTETRVEAHAAPPQAPQRELYSQQLSPKEKLKLALGNLTELIAQLPDSFDGDSHSKKARRR